jgi:hypothetical protein
MQDFYEDTGMFGLFVLQKFLIFSFHLYIPAVKVCCYNED